MDLSPNVKSDPRSRLPGIDRLAGEVRATHPELPDWAVVAAAREVVGAARARLSQGEPESVEGPAADWALQVAQRAVDLSRPHPRGVVNATGVLLHTNLGRAPLAQGAIEAAREAAGYASLELDLETGRRGNRLGPVVRKLCELGDAEAAYACNNNAAALMLALDTLARGREVVVSRGELVEIGGSFRVPDIMERAGVRLVEVGTTNRTHPRDYEAAIGPDTALLLKVHRSNFSLEGFTAEVGLADLVAIGHAHGVPVLEDLGSGTFLDLREAGLPADSWVPGRLATGVDAVCFSGDKLLGGPQAGLLLGRAEAIEGMRRNPLARALRLDKMSLAALDWTLSCLLRGEAEHEIPVVRQMLEPLHRVERRAHDLAKRIEKLAGDDLEVAVGRERAPVGGGSIPGFALDTWVVELRRSRAIDRFAGALRTGPVPVLGRVRGDALLLDLRTLTPEDVPRVEAAVQWAIAAEAATSGDR